MEVRLYTLRLVASPNSPSDAIKSPFCNLFRATLRLDKFLIVNFFHDCLLFVLLKEIILTH